MGVLAVPGDRHPAAVPAEIGAAGTEQGGILAQLRWEVLDLGEAELVALIDVDAAGECHGEQRGGPCAAGAEGQVDGGAEGALPVTGVLAAVAGDVPGDVVVGEHPGGVSA